MIALVFHVAAPAPTPQEPEKRVTVKLVCMWLAIAAGGAVIVYNYFSGVPFPTMPGAPLP